MFETHKIDTFFSGEKNLLDEEEKVFLTRRMKVVRFFRLFLPCLTALLLGSGVLLFDFSEHNDTGLPLAEEEKIYFEKFRMKNTVFEITEKDNQFSVLKADIVEEKNPGQKVYDLTNPDAWTKNKDKLITIKSKVGLYKQTEQELILSTDVLANYNKEMDIKTNSATYNFATETGFGNERIMGMGVKGSFEADKFTFDKNKGIFTLIKNVSIYNSTKKLVTDKEATFYLNENKFIALDATVFQEKDSLKGDTLTIFFKDSKDFEIVKAISQGNTIVRSQDKTATANKGVYTADDNIIRLYDNVKIVDKSGYVATASLGIYDNNKHTFTLEKNVKITKENNTITADKAVYFQDKDEFFFYNNVKVTQLDNVATAKKGVYYVKKGIAELMDNVVITKNGNVVKGDKAISDFNTSKSRIVAKNGGRITGKLIEKTLTDKKGSK